MSSYARETADIPQLYDVATFGTTITGRIICALNNSAADGWVKLTDDDGTEREYFINKGSWIPGEFSKAALATTGSPALADGVVLFGLVQGSKR